ncbi:hypothetical protein P3L10_013271 [Capsicum annuum]|uniref:uncharacterized protein LOC107867732 n=1 Tax=Capsicum annuum TaxID=4072 RepID=UPI001FB18777|nr:uncharacterized protein LOC107867732 [Capsicum annuum]
MKAWLNPKLNVVRSGGVPCTAKFLLPPPTSSHGIACTESSVLSQLPGDAKASAIKAAPSRTTGKERAWRLLKKGLFMVKNDLLELLSSRSDKKYSFGSDAARLQTGNCQACVHLNIHHP